MPTPIETPEKPAPGGRGENPSAAAAALRDEWLRLGERLSPVIGVRGMQALYARTLHLGGDAFPWLRELPAGALATMDVDLLVAAVAARDADEATNVSKALLARFRELLASLVGAALTDQLIGPDKEPLT
jgi:hypothetical protein